ncbi:MAG: hypothetical protein WD649_01220 [Thermoleophilaceae bacterium]
MPIYEVSRTLVKSPPELWEELQGDALGEAVGATSVDASDDDRTLTWRSSGAHGTAVIEPSGWGTKVTLTAEVAEQEKQVAEAGFWGRFRHAPPPAPPAPEGLDRKLEALLDELGSAHRRQPFSD